jgi:uncharacterized protein YjdB
MADVPTYTMRIGPPADTLQLSAQGYDQYGNPIAAVLAFASSNPAAATVDALGNITPVAIGQTVITASGPGAVSSSANVNVIANPVLTSVVIGVAQDT